jgi:hypothetical protein
MAKHEPNPSKKRQNLGPIGGGAHTMTRAEYYERSKDRDTNLDHMGHAKRRGGLSQAT